MTDAARPPRLDPGDDEVDEVIQVWTGAQARDFLAYVDDHDWRGLWHLALGTAAACHYAVSTCSTADNGTLSVAGSSTTSLEICGLRRTRTCRRAEGHGPR